MSAYTAAEVTAKLSIGYPDLRKLGACNVLVGERHGREIRYRRTDVDELAQRPTLHAADTGAVAVRLGAPKRVPAKERDPAWPDRAWTGWNAKWIEDIDKEQRRMDAARGWWRIAERYRSPGTALVVLVGIVVVDVFDVLGDDTPPEHTTGSCRLELGRATLEQRQAYAGRLLRLPAGPLSVPAPRWPAS